MVDRLKSELAGIHYSPDEPSEALRLEVSRVTADRDILALNLSSAVKAAVAMTEERDAAERASSAAKEAATEALKRQNELYAQVSP